MSSSDSWGSDLHFSIKSDDTLQFTDTNSSSKSEESTRRSSDLEATTDVTTRVKMSEIVPFCDVSSSTVNTNQTTHGTCVAKSTTNAKEQKALPKEHMKARSFEVKTGARYKKGQRRREVMKHGFSLLDNRSADRRNQAQRQKRALERAREEIEQQRQEETKRKRKRIARQIGSDIAEMRKGCQIEQDHKKLSDNPKSVKALKDALDAAKSSEEVVKRSDRSLIIPSCFNKRNKDARDVERLEQEKIMQTRSLAKERANKW